GKPLDGAAHGLAAYHQHGGELAFAGKFVANLQNAGRDQRDDLVADHLLGRLLVDRFVERRKGDRHTVSPATGLLSSPVSAFHRACHGLYRSGVNLYPERSRQAAEFTRESGRVTLGDVAQRGKLVEIEAAGRTGDGDAAGHLAAVLEDGQR